MHSYCNSCILGQKIEMETAVRYAAWLKREDVWKSEK